MVLDAQAMVYRTGVSNHIPDRYDPRVRHERDFEPNALRRIREDRGLSQQELADKVGTSQAQIDRLEKSQRKMTTKWAKRLAPALECAWFDLVNEADLGFAKDEIALLETYQGMSEPEKDGLFRFVVKRDRQELKQQPPALLKRKKR